MREVKRMLKRVRDGIVPDSLRNILKTQESQLETVCLGKQRTRSHSAPGLQFPYEILRFPL